MGRVGTGVGELFAAVGAFEGFFTAVNAKVLLKVVLEFKGFVAVVAFEFAQRGALVVADHVPLQPVYVRETLVADLARLLTKEKRVVKTEFAIIIFCI